MGNDTDFSIIGISKASNPSNPHSAVLSLAGKLLQNVSDGPSRCGTFKRPQTTSFLALGAMGKREAAEISRKWGLLKKPPSRPPFQRGRRAHLRCEAARAEGGSRVGGVGLGRRDPAARARAEAAARVGRVGRVPLVPEDHPALWRPASQAHL